MEKSGNFHGILLGKILQKKIPFILNYHKYISLHLYIQYSQQNVEYAAHIF